MEARIQARSLRPTIEKYTNPFLTLALRRSSERREEFLVVLQKTEQKYFKDRTVYYATFPIAEQAKQGEWDFEFKAVYTIAMLDFIFDEGEAESEEYCYDIKLADIDI